MEAGSKRRFNLEPAVGGPSPSIYQFLWIDGRAEQRLLSLNIFRTTNRPSAEPQILLDPPK